jgi:hypothetical protein
MRRCLRPKNASIEALFELADNCVVRYAVTRLSILGFLLLILRMPAGSQTQEPQRSPTTGTVQNSKVQDGTPPVSQSKALAAKKELSKKLLSDPAIVGVGVGSFHSSPVIYVYVTPEASKETLGRIPKKYEGVPISVVKSEPIKPQ